MNCISDQQQKVDDKVIYYRLYSGIPVIHGGEHVNVNIEHIKAGYYSIKALNPTGIVPIGPEIY
ncbi:hypothetical protein GCM10011607_42630 [Shewanella inventionis]|uniref:Uncharacterized protein n=1 Tax=Shewanella inventionis TaxID=1738770 RepID=A0ABQ1JV26_9GAMM|nr:hypothetical protein [Shewanella inventionis]GGB77994.1 hypothetical protein GCM10011607_42630 [Shewanella inventionis]